MSSGQSYHEPWFSTTTDSSHDGSRPKYYAKRTGRRIGAHLNKVSQSKERSDTNAKDVQNINTDRNRVGGGEDEGLMFWPTSRLREPNISLPKLDPIEAENQELPSMDKVTRTSEQKPPRQKKHGSPRQPTQRPYLKGGSHFLKNPQLRLLSDFNDAHLPRRGFWTLSQQNRANNIRKLGREPNINQIALFVPGKG